MKEVIKIKKKHSGCLYSLCDQDRSEIWGLPFLQTHISSFPTGISDRSWAKPPQSSSVTICTIRRYRSITKQFFRKADGVALMYDITSEYSFSDVRYWLSCIQVGEEGQSPLSPSSGSFSKIKNQCRGKENTASDFDNALKSRTACFDSWEMGSNSCLIKNFLEISS